MPARTPLASAARSAMPAGGQSPPPQGSRDSIIPASWTWMALFCVLGLASWAGVLWLGLSDWAKTAGLAELAALPHGPIPRFFSTICLLLASQLSFLILWRRSRSRKDFMGRYRIWAWGGLFLSALCLCLATGLHLPAARLARQRWPIDCYRPDVMYWLAPLAAATLALYRLLGREMRHALSSRIAWECAWGLGLVCGALQLGLERHLPSQLQAPVTAGAVTLWHLSLALALLVHARYVVHVTNEAGPRSTSFSTRSARWMHARLMKLGALILGVIWKKAEEVDQASPPPVAKPAARPVAAENEARAAASAPPARRAPPAALARQLVAGDPPPEPSRQPLLGWLWRTKTAALDPETPQPAAPEKKPASAPAKAQTVKAVEEPKPAKASPAAAAAKQPAPEPAPSRGWFWQRSERTASPETKKPSPPEQPAKKPASVAPADATQVKSAPAAPSAATRPAPAKVAAKPTAAASSAGPQAPSVLGWLWKGPAAAASEQPASGNKPPAPQAPPAAPAGKRVDAPAAAKVPAPHIAAKGPASTSSGGERGQVAASRPPQTGRFDEEDDDDDAPAGRGGLSKQERKRLKKLQRQQARER